MNPASDDKTKTDLRLEDVIAEITSELEAGREVDLPEYERRYPEYTESLRRLIPAMDAIGQLADGAGCDETARTMPSLENAGFRAQQLGDFRIVREIGRGGMGVVYEAQQISLDRRVALKVLPFASMLDGRQLARFKTEAQAAACLHHPSIVPVHSVGSDRGVHYYAMQYIDGQSLATALATLKEVWSTDSSDLTSARDSEIDTVMPSEAETEDLPLSSLSLLHSSADGPGVGYCRNVAKLGIQAAEALEHAHQSGVIHRDIKPGNLLLDGDDKVWVTDFGLARIEQNSELTMTGDVIGTIRYMSPEQATSPHTGVDHRSDVYALGVTLYELLTLRPAYSSDDRQELLRLVMLDDPKPPRNINRHIPAELETIVMTAMQKEPSDRYQSAQALADDLRCFLEDRNILARRPTILARVQKWSRRHPAIVRSAAVALILVALVSWVASILVVREQGQTRKALTKSEENFARSETNRRLAEKTALRAARLLYVRGLGLAARSWFEGDGTGAASLLESNPAYTEHPELRGFEWDYLENVLSKKHEVISRSSSEIMATTWSRDGLHFATGDSSGEIKIWEPGWDEPVSTLRGHRGPIHELAFHPDGYSLASCGDDGSLRVWSVLESTETGAIIECHGGEPVFSVAYSPEGDRFVTGGGDYTCRVWETASRRPLFELNGHGRTVRSVAFSPDGSTIASGGHDRRARLWNATNGKPIRQLKGHTGMVLSVAFSPAGKYVLSGSNDHSIRVWHRESGDVAAIIRGHHDGIQTLAMLPDGKTIVAGDRSGQVRLWHIRGRRVVDRFDGEFISPFLSIRLSPDGRSWAGLDRDGQVLVRDIGLQHTRVIHADLPVPYSFGVRERIAFSPDGRQLYCGDRIFKRGPDESRDFGAVIPLEVPAASSGHFSPNGKKLAVGWQSTIRIVNSDDGSKVDEWETRFSPLTGVRFSPDGKRIAAWFLNDPVVMFSVETGEELQVFDRMESRIVDLEYSPKGDLIATCTDFGEVRLWDVESGDYEILDTGGRRVGSISWLYDGDAIALSTPGETDVVLWLDGSGLIEPIGVDDEVVDTDVTDRPSLLLSHEQDFGAVVRDLDRLEIRSESEDVLHGHTDRVWSVSLSPDGKQILSAGRDGTLRRWTQSPDQWQWLTRRRHRDDYISDFTWSEQGKSFVMAQMARGSIQNWPEGVLQGQVSWIEKVGTDPIGFVLESVASNRDGSFLATGHRCGIVNIWSRDREKPIRSLAAASIGETVSVLRFSDDGKFLAAASRNDNVLKVFRTSDWSVALSVPAYDCDDLSFSSDGRSLVYCDGRDAVILDTDSWDERLRLQGHSITVHGVAFTSDNRRLVTACEDRKLRMWDPNNGDLLHVFSGHTASILRVAFSRDDSTLVSGDADGTIKLWHLETGQELYTLGRLGFEVEKLAFDPGGEHLLALTEDGKIHSFAAKRDLDESTRRDRSVSPTTPAE